MARHVESLGHAIASSAPAYPFGTGCGVQVCPPFVVARMAAPGPGDAEPMAVQCIGSAQAMAVKLATPGWDAATHVAPPSLVPIMLGAPIVELNLLTASQVRAVEQETSTSSPTLDGIVCVVQLEPPSFVPMAIGAPNVEKPTPIHLATEPHETPFSPLTPVGRL